MATYRWDVYVRLSHWVLAAAVLTSWWTGEEGIMDVHMISGYVVLGVVLFRLAWGLVGSENARFLHFPLAPRRLFRHLRSLPGRNAETWSGHSPVGSVMVLFMLAYFAVQASLGLLSSDGILVEGPLAAMVSGDTTEWASDLHHELGELVLYIVGVHVAAVLYYLVWKRENLVGAMVTGRRAADRGGREPWFASTWRGLALAITTALAVVTLVQWGRASGF